ncbi:hypothetical protein PN36_33735 [Candidatus Thiomargarita nelsonii]|uniref:Outer membrane protein beta-barrel domain-containing protein n=1 Tax=Candidatus Thiomargarita nelsonii TaxID=1003181 RepID=A0A0A6P2H3_9GAMM|nr:hypothetical protein PN36_33735 [Candidatus Thiomargarita nelsonii]
MKTKLKKNYLRSTIAACMLAASPNLFAASFDVAVGLGIPYGILGANFEFYPIKNLSVSAGLGTTVLADVGYDVGLEYYLGRDGGWNPRLSVHYGTNGILKTTTCMWWYCKYESFEGITAGVGIKKLWGNHGFAFDLFYIVSSDLFDRQDELEERGFTIDSAGFGSERLKIGIAYVYSF